MLRHGTRDPMPQTKGTPTCQAWRRQRSRRSGSIRNFVPFVVLRAAVDTRDRQPASRGRCTSKTAYSKSSLRTLGAVLGAHLHWPDLPECSRRNHLLPFDVGQRCFRNSKKDFGGAPPKVSAEIALPAPHPRLRRRAAPPWFLPVRDSP